MAVDRGLLPGAHRIEQSCQMGLGLEGANTAHGRLINRLPTSLRLARAGAVVRLRPPQPWPRRCVPDAERGRASIAVTAPDTAGLGGPQPVARITAGPQHRRCHTQWLALVLDALVLPSLLASAIPLAAAQPV